MCFISAGSLNLPWSSLFGNGFLGEMVMMGVRLGLHTMDDSGGPTNGFGRGPVFFKLPE